MGSTERRRGCGQGGGGTMGREPEDALWRRLRTFHIDEGAPRLSFAKRLAR
jgi:hypothetical protein